MTLQDLNKKYRVRTLAPTNHHPGLIVIGHFGSERTASEYIMDAIDAQLGEFPKHQNAIWPEENSKSCRFYVTFKKMTAAVGEKAASMV